VTAIISIFNTCKALRHVTEKCHHVMPKYQIILKTLIK
jgi:hypothetical protein